MDCTQYRRQISDLVKRSRPLDANSGPGRHIKQCELCRRFYEDLLLIHALKQEPDAEPDTGFADRVIEKAVRHHRRGRKKMFFAGFSAAAAIMAAVVAAYMINFTGLQRHMPAGGEEIVSISPGEAQTINILIETTQPRKAATFAINLDGDIELTGRPGSRNIEWQTDMAEGKNLLELPVKAQKPSGGRMKISYRYNGVEKEVRILVRPRDNETTKKQAKIQQT